MLGISVIVASYGRVDSLLACLQGLRAQTVAADEVIVVGRTSDPETAARVALLQRGWAELRYVPIDAEGAVAAYNRGLAAAGQPLVAYVDDDAVPTPDWISRIVNTFTRDARVGAVGGRDILADTADHRGGAGARPVSVGRLQWFGRMTANHHLGCGPARDVDFLKGVNMSFRRAAVVGHCFDVRLKGRGAQVHSELSICLPLRRQGWRVVYDPAIVVAHSPAPRPAGDDRRSSDADAMRAVAHNESLAILDYLGPGRRWVFVLWSVLAGTTESPGLAVSIRDLARRRPAVGRRLWATQRGRVDALRTRRLPPPGGPGRPDGLAHPDSVMSHAGGG